MPLVSTRGFGRQENFPPPWPKFRETNSLRRAFARSTLIRYTGAVSRPEESKLQRLAARLVGSPFFWVLFLVVAFGWPLVRVARTVLPPALPVFETVPSFELVDQNGQPYGTGQLKGRVWLLSAGEIAAPTADKLATELGKIQHRVRNLGPAFHLVTVAVDDGENPSRLHEFAGRHRVSPRMWSFLTGDPADRTS